MKLSPRLHRYISFLISGVWIYHGLYSKILDGIPRHRQIVERVLGTEWRDPATTTVGLMEISLGLWALTGRWRIACATVQTAAIVSMNTLEIILARDLLISAVGMPLLNGVFLAVVWFWATQNPRQPA